MLIIQFVSFINSKWHQARILIAKSTFGKWKQEWSALISLVLLFFWFRRWGWGGGGCSWLGILSVSIPMLLLQVKEVVVMRTMWVSWVVGVGIVVVIMVANGNWCICLR